MSEMVSEYLGETCTWLGNFREFLTGMRNQRKMVYDETIPVQPGDEPMFERLQFSGFSGEDFDQAYKLLDEGTCLLETVNRDSHAYAAGDELRLLERGIASLVKMVGFLAVKLFDYADTEALYDAGDGSFRDNEEFTGFMDRFNHLSEDSMVTVLSSGRGGILHQPDYDLS